jgi:hypothetical protein
MSSVLERVNEKYAELQETDDVPDAVLERIATAIDRIQESLVAVGTAEDFDELEGVMQEVREDRREARADRLRRRWRRLHADAGASAGVTS